MIKLFLFIAVVLAHVPDALPARADEACAFESPPRVLVEPALRDRRDGWQVLVALHSHVFHPGQPEIDGILAPSEPDAGFHLQLHAASDVREAWITNGVHTVKMSASSFPLFRRPAANGCE